MISLTAVVPIYNEEQFLEQSVERLIEHDIYENILLIDNNSLDSSYEIGKNLQKKYKKVSIYKTDDTAGKGVVISYSRKLIETSHIIIHDADLEYFPSDIVGMFDLAKDNPKSLILGSRFIGSKERKNIYKRTFFANKVMSLFFSIVNFYSISDVATCYKLMPSEFFVNTNFKEKGFSIEIELLSKFLKFNKSIIEVPIKYMGRSYDEGKKIKTRDGFKYLFSTLKYRFVN